MAKFFTHDLANELIDYIVSAYTTLDVALFTVAPDKDGTGGTEVSGGSYARQEITMATVFPTAAASSEIDSEVAVQFPVATAIWGNIVGAGLYDGSDLKMYADMPAPKYIGDTDTFTAPIGAMFIRNA